MAETNRIEYKQELTPDVDIEKEVVAFLNYKEGGFIYIGIDRDGKTVGVDDIDGCMLKLKDRIKNNVSPSAMGLFDIATEQRDGLSIIKLTVASGIEKPYFKTKYGMTPKGAYIRVGTSAEPMPQEQIDRLFAMRTRNSIGRIVSNRQDLTFEQLRIYYDEHGKRLNDNFKRTLELLTEDGKYNYVAYLLADENNNSIKVAKYASLDRCDLIENNEYGYCSLIKATKSVLAKLEVENRTAATITPVERIETPLWNRIALREAVINAIVHNDYSFEVPPKFEIFPDRLEITSAGRLPESLSHEEFFNGISIPRNKELMRIYRDVELVESLGSGIPRILRAYGEESFKFTDNFIRITFPVDMHDAAHVEEEGTKSAPSRNQEGTGSDTTSKTNTDTNSVTNTDTNSVTNTVTLNLSNKQKEVLEYCIVERNSKEILEHIGVTYQHKNITKFIISLVEVGLLERTIPNAPKSPKQRYIVKKNNKKEQNCNH